MPDERFVAIAPVNIEDEYSDITVKSIREVKNINYIEFVKPENIREYLSNAKGLICTSKHEGFANTFLEAWNAGTPVYTFGVDPNEVIKRSGGRLGFIFPSTARFVEGIDGVINFVDSGYMHDYLSKYHSLSANVNEFLNILSN